MASSVHSIDSVLEQPAMGRYRWGIYAFCGLLMALEGYDAYIVANLAPFIARSLDIPIPSMGFVFTAQAAGMALGFYTIPVLADRIGRRGIVLIGSATFGVLTILSTMVGTLGEFTFVRFLAFGALGGTMPNIVALVTELMPESRRGKLITWLFIGHGLGASLAGLVGPTFIAWHSWEAAFWAGGIALLLLVPVLYVYLPESCRYLVTREAADPRIGETLRKVDPGLTFAPGTVFVTDEIQVSGSPVAGLFRDGRALMTLLLWIAMGGALCSVASFSAWLPSYLHVLGGLDPSTATRMSSFSAFGAITGPILLTFLMKRFGMPASLTMTLFVSFFAMAALTLVAQAPVLGWVLGFSFGLLVIGSQAGLNALVASSYPSSNRSTGIGWAGGIGRITSMIGPGLGGAMLAAQWPALWIYSAIAAPLLIAAAAMFVFHITKSAASPREARLAPARG
jgi:AAHS family 4-hydroxybenzoate transporter-like MFS transporter